MLLLHLNFLQIFLLFISFQLAGESYRRTYTLAYAYILNSVILHDFE